MVDFSEENKESLVSHFSMFANKLLMDMGKEVATVNLRKAADDYVSNEIAMQKAMKEYYEYLRKQGEENNLLLLEIKKEKGNTFFKYLKEIIEESEGIRGVAEIVKTPNGTFQEEKYGRQIKGVWVDQWSVGDTGDSWEGTVCVQLSENRYFKFNYSM